MAAARDRPQRNGRAEPETAPRVNAQEALWRQRGPGPRSERPAGPPETPSPDPLGATIDGAIDGARWEQVGLFGLVRACNLYPFARNSRIDAFARIRDGPSRFYGKSAHFRPWV